MLNSRPVLRAVVFVVLLALFTAAHVSFAYGQNFTLTPSPLSPAAGVDPGGFATATVTVQAIGSFDSSVSLSCMATSTQFTTDLPVCSVSPPSVTPGAIAALTITTVGGTQAGLYTINVIGTSGSETEPAAPLLLQVVNVPQDYTLTVLKAISPGTVTAGSGAQATVTVTPIASYTGSVTLSCLSVTPTVTASPICSFTPPTVAVTNGVAPTSVLTISTYGTTQTTAKLLAPRIINTFWLAVPALALVGVGANRSGRKKLMWILLLMALAVSLLFLPSCSATNTTSNNNNGLITPKNTYTFTLTGVDQNGVSPSNSTTTTDEATVSLTVN